MRYLFQKIKNRTLYTQLVFTALAFVVMVVLSYLFMSLIVRDSLARNANSVLNFAENRVSLTLLESRSTLENVSATARGMILHGDSVERVADYISDVAEYTILTDRETTGIRSVYGYFETMPGGPVLLHGKSWLPPQDYNPAELDWYKMAVAADGSTIETKPYISGTNEVFFTYAKCIFDENGRRLGVVCIDAKINALGDDIVNLVLAQGGYGMLLSQDLLMLAHPNANFVGKDLNDSIIPIAIFKDSLLNGQDIFEQPVTSYTGDPAVTFFHQLPNGWHLGVVIPEGQYYKSIGNMALILCFLGISLAAALCFILISLDFAKTKSTEESRQKSAFLATMSHEIRTPINAIVGMTTIGKRSNDAERKDYCFTKIDDASKHLLGVINNILDMSKIEANKIELFTNEFNFEKMLQSVVNVVNFRVDEKQHQLTVYIDKNIPPMLVADDQKLAQVITNLLSNAIKFTPENGLISLTTSFLGEEAGICTIQVKISDTGIGLSPEQQAKLFQSFQQAEASTTRKYGGTGLGLAIAKSIVELMGGKIWVESELGKGSTFAFTVKAERGSRPELNQQGINWSNIRILTVDDDQYILDYFQEIVSGFGAYCEVAASAQEALNIVEQKGAYNIYFVDWKMPEVDGITLTKKIRSQEKQPGNSIVIMISSAELSGVETEAKEAGVDKFLLKPLFPSTIADVISECIGIVNDKIEEIHFDTDGIFAGYCVLLAEDVEINRVIVEALLEPTLVKIDCAENGTEAVKMFTAAPEKYQLIFMDVQMPEMDGYEATRQIRASDAPNAKTVPIVAMTANVFKDDIEDCLAAGMNSHLSKPLDVNDLLETMVKYLKKPPS
ncbi:MAG: response regulator [Sporomusaceae bacterium]|jgi:signal transduction histidine kinase/DNA-binding response OmpR family regulator|nr:response regulator [Sporomusaceae bacterium]